MRRGILYIPGAGQHVFNQSASLIADRIARALRYQLASKIPFHYRITVTRNDHYFENIPIDIASIEVKKSDPSGEGGWETVFDVIELKYLPRFTKSFSGFSPLERVVHAIPLLRHPLRKPVRRKTPDKSLKTSGSSNIRRQSDNCTDEHDRNDELKKIRACDKHIFRALERQFYVGLVLATGKWFLISLGAILGVLELSGMRILEALPLGRFGTIIVAVFIGLVVSFVYFGRESKTTSENQDAIEACSLKAYVTDDREFSCIINAILDSADYLVAKNYTRLDLVSLSLGAILATDAIFPKPPNRTTIRSKDGSPLPLAKPQIETWVTIGFPYDFAESQQPGYFKNKRYSRLLDFRKWFNVYIAHDPLSWKPIEGSKIRINCVDGEYYSPSDQWEFKPNEKQFTKDVIEGLPKDPCSIRRFRNHCLYWDDQNARATSCFEEIAHKAGWTEDLENILLDM